MLQEKADRTSHFAATGESMHVHVYNQVMPAVIIIGSCHDA